MSVMFDVPKGGGLGMPLHGCAILAVDPFLVLGT